MQIEIQLQLTTNSFTVLSTPKQLNVPTKYQSI